MTRRARKRFQRSKFDDRRRPRATFAACAVLAAFMVIAYRAAPDILPTFFQRVAGVANAVLAMLVVVFAIREFGHGFNRFHLPWFGRISTSKLLGAITFIGVLLWWFSPWAPIKAG